MGANTKYKDSVFSLLFSDPSLLRELYCALEDVTLPADVPVNINTLRDVLFLDKINDISFEIGGKLVILIEHQSTINPNMALRLLMYVARVYEKIIGDRNIYSSRLVTVPRPEFFVLYNGVSPFPDEQILNLSDVFEKTDSLDLPEKEIAALELVVKVININQGKNENLARKCKTLAGYSVFVAKVREFEKECGDKAEALKRAVRYCRNHDILKEFLEKNATEVINMLMTEWNWDDALAVRYEDGMEDGIEKGREDEREEIARNALAKGLSPELICTITGLDMETVKSLEVR
jgi:predicted transposase/invertase (TIGR01784 family)